MIKKLLMLSFILISCKESEITFRPLANELVGTTWITHLGTGINDNLEYIQILRFTSETKLYFMNYNSNGVILSDVVEYNFVRISDKIQADNKNNSIIGYKDGNIIRFKGYEYYYIDVNGSVSEYLKKK